MNYPYACVLGLHVVASIWCAWSAHRAKVSATVAWFVVGTLAATGARYLVRTGGALDGIAPNVAAILDQSLFCAWSPAAYVCGRYEYDRIVPARVSALAVTSSVVIAALSLMVDKQASSALLVFQQASWAGAFGLLIWDSSLGGARRDATMRIFGVLVLELLMGAWFGLRERDEYLVPQALTCLFFLALPVLARGAASPKLRAQ